MGSLNASGVPVVPKQYVGYRSYGRNIIETSGSNPYGQRSARTAEVLGVPAIERSGAAFGTQSTPATESFLKQGDFVKHTESVNDTTTARILEDVPVSSGSQPELALIEKTVLRQDHRGNRIVEQKTDKDLVVNRQLNDSVRPPG